MEETSREDVIRRVAKLKERLEHSATGGQQAQTEAELEVVAATMQRLMLKHKLSLSDVEYATLEREEPVITKAVEHEKRPGWIPRKARSAWEETLAGVVARAHFCTIMVHAKSNRLSLIGRASDIAIAEYMILTLQRSVARISIEEQDRYLARQHAGGSCLVCDRTPAAKARDQHHFRSSFLLAFTARLAVRYDEERRAAEGSNTMALVRVNKADAAVRDYIASGHQSGALVKATRRDLHSDNSEGIRRGHEVADSVSLKANAIGPADAKRLGG